jgi:broad specificity phosphatase PhoE
MKKIFYLIRHAESESNVNLLHQGDSYLTEKGILEASGLARHLKGVPVDGILTSTVIRAKLTANQVGIATGIKATSHDCLKERKCLYSSELEFIPTEPFDKFKDRLMEAKALLENSSGRHFVVISHAIFIKAFISHIMLGGLDDENYINRVSGRLIIDHAKVSKLIFNAENGEWKIISLNGRV